MQLGLFGDELVQAPQERAAAKLADAKRLFHYYWDTIQHCVPPETILAALTGAGFPEARRNVVLGVFSEYLGRKG